MKSNLIDIEVIVHHETKPGSDNEGAVLVSDDGDRKKAVWIPKSVAEIDRKRGKESVTITLPESIAMDRGLI